MNLVRFLQVVLIVIFATVCFSCQNMADKIYRYAENSCSKDTIHTCLVDLNDFVDFEWDYLYIFESYTMPNEISDAIGFRYKEGYPKYGKGLLGWMQNLKLSFSSKHGYVNDGTNRLIFTKNNEVVYQESHGGTPSKINFCCRTSYKSDTVHISYRKFVNGYSSIFKVKRVVDKNGENMFYLLYLD